MRSALDQNTGYLMSLLEDEFSSRDDVRIVPMLPAGTVRSPDLPQNYDPESSDLHLKKGVRVIARNRDYFFPTQWVSSKRSDLIHATIDEIKDSLER